MDIMELLAKKLNMNELDIHLAKVIGLLHYIGRFEQAKIAADGSTEIKIYYDRNRVTLTFETVFDIMYAF